MDREIKNENSLLNRILKDEKRFALCSLGIGATLGGGMYAMTTALVGFCGAGGMPVEQAHEILDLAGTSGLYTGTYTSLGVFLLANLFYLPKIKR